MRNFNFEVTSSSTGEVYLVNVHADESRFSCTCTCQAAKNNTMCKHRTNIISGNPEGLTGGDVSQLENIPVFFKGTDAEQSLEEINILEMEAKAVKAKIGNAKKKYSRILSQNI